MIIKDTRNGLDSTLSMDDIVWGTKKWNDIDDYFFHYITGQNPTVHS